MTTTRRISVKCLSDYQELKRILCVKWKEAEASAGVFRYKLNVRRQEVLPGDLQFLVQVNIALEPGV